MGPSDFGDCVNALERDSSVPYWIRRFLEDVDVYARRRWGDRWKVDATAMRIMYEAEIVDGQCRYHREPELYVAGRVDSEKGYCAYIAIEDAPPFDKEYLVSLSDEHIQGTPSIVGFAMKPKNGNVLVVFKTDDLAVQ
jgi:hypothetical protein